jgi:hypothetical protein
MPDLLGESRLYPSCPRPHSKGSCRRAVAAHATAMARLGCPMGPQTVAPSCHSRPPAHAAPRHCGLGLEPRLRFYFFFSFWFSKIPRKCLERLKIIENRVQILEMQIKLCCTPFGQIIIVGLTKCAFVQYFIIQNSKNSDTKIIVYNLYLQIFWIFACIFTSVLVDHKIFP